MAESSREIVAQIEGTRRALGANFNELERKVKTAADWRHHYEQNPLAWVAGALFGATVLGLSAGRRRHPFTKVRAAETEPSRGSRLGSSIVSLVDNATDALIGVAALRVQNFIADTVPGFREEFERRYPTPR